MQNSSRHDRIVIDLSELIIDSKTIMTPLFSVSLVNVKSAAVSALIMAVIGMAGYILSVGDVFGLNLHTLVNIGALSALTAIVSLAKSLMTTSTGTFLGFVKIIE